MLINGEKWACDACVRGHRVSNCQHSERPLQHINKKGRPVSQCQHCRAMRKSRSAHSKCDCGEKTHKCAHLKVTADGHKESCCCNHGGRCTCSHKKEILQLNPVPESDSDKDNGAPVKLAKEARPRRRANTVHSGLFSLNENSHRKPTQKSVKSSRKTGPYQLNRVSSLQSATTLGNLSLDASSFRRATGANSPASSGGFSQEHSRARSEAASPLMTGSSAFADLNGQLSPLDLSNIDYPPYAPSGYDNVFGNEQPIYSAGLSATPIDWSNLDGLEFPSKPTEPTASSYSQPTSLAAYDFSSAQEQAPALASNTPTSGETSELEEASLPHGVDEFPDVSFVPASTATNRFNLARMPTSLLGTTDVAALSYNDLKLMKAGSKFLPTPASLTGEEPAMTANSSGGVINYPLVDEEPALWLGDYPQGLSGLPNVTDSPDSSLPTFWDT